MIRLLLCLVALSLGALTSAAVAAAIPDISHDELVAALKDKQVVLLDANGTESYIAGHIPGAIDYDADKATLAAHLPADKGALIVAYCGGPQCHAYQAAADDATTLGYTNVKHLREGISGWKDSGEPLETVTAK